MRIAAVGSAFPAHYYDQDELLRAFAELWGAKFHNPARLEQIHRNVLVGGRHLALPMAEYARLRGFGDANDAFLQVAPEVGGQAVRRAVEAAGLTARDVDYLLFVTVTGLATPSIDALLVNRLELRNDVKRTPIFGLGCVAGAAGVARAADALRGDPGGVAVLLSVELCSLTLQREDLSIPNLIATGLFGDGAAAVVLTGSEHEAGRGGPRIVGTASRFYPGTEDVMGWRIGERGFEIILSADVPDMVTHHTRDDVDAFLARHGLRRADIGVYVCHPGGPKVIEALAAALEVDDAALAATWDSLRRVGNLSSASVLLVLADALAHRPPPGTFGLMLAMGPGFCSELVLLQW